MIVRPARSRVAHVKGPSDNSASGSEVKRCRDCLRASRDIKETIHNGLLLLRVRYGLPYSELPDCDPQDLSRFLSFLLLQGQARPSVAFPRRQRQREDGLCDLQRLCRMHRWELAHACASIKRNFPQSCSRHTPSPRSSWERNAVSQPPPTSPEYLAHVRRCVTQLFPAGWDKAYGSFVGSHLPNRTARFDASVTADDFWQGHRKEFFTGCIEGVGVRPLLMSRYKEVQSAGKKRPLLIFDQSVEFLAPLHKLLYKKLCEKDWLLCGPPTEERMSSVCVGEYQTSVDLVSATDGLSHDVSNTMLDALFFTSVKIPRSIRSLAYASLSPFFKDCEGVIRRVRHGQMMGSYLSFPLLCLHSYCAASWAARFDANARFLVNGDDCVISASRSISVQDYPSGYRLNTDKTIRAKDVVEVNSTAFLRMRGRWRVVRHLRRGGATTDYVGARHMAQAVMISPAFVDAYQRARIGRRWGFMPSQLGHKTYPSFLRQRGLSFRYHTPLPEAGVIKDERLLACRGKPSAVEVEALRSFFWEHGRGGMKKRDAFNPSCGKVRRTYGYRAQPYMSRLSFVGWSGRGQKIPSKENPGVFYLPDSFISEEERKGLDALEGWRQAILSLATSD